MELSCTKHPDRAPRARCVECGQHLCQECRIAVARRNYCRPCVPESLKRKIPGTRSPAIAAVLSVIPGLGQAFVGRIKRGMVFFGGALTMMAFLHQIPDPIPLFLWVYNLLDAHSLASERNSRLLHGNADGEGARQRKYFALFGAGLALFVVTRTLFIPDLNPDLLWPGALLLYGAFVFFNWRIPRVQPA